MLWGSEAWWTGAAHVLTQVAPIITGLSKWTPLQLLLDEAGLPPLTLLLNNGSRRYGIRILLARTTTLANQCSFA